jgi:hypothetical protein
MNKPSDQNIRDEMARAIAAYNGPVTICPPGKARAMPKPRPDRATHWLREHRNDGPIIDQQAKRKQMRMACQQRERITNNNAPLLKRIKRGSEFRPARGVPTDTNQRRGVAGDSSRPTIVLSMNNVRRCKQFWETARPTIPGGHLRQSAWPPERLTQQTHAGSA